MIYRKILILFLGILIFTACQKNKRDIIAKSWKVTEMTIAGAKLSGEDAGGLTYTFKNDGTYEYSEKNQKEKGKWALSDDGKKLTLSSEGGQTFDKEVKELTDDKLVIAGEEYSTPKELVMVPAK